MYRSGSLAAAAKVCDSCLRYASTETLSTPIRTKPRLHRKLYYLTRREEHEEGLRDFLPPKPLLPAGWRIQHQTGLNRFDLMKNVEIRQCGTEEMHIITLVEAKEYEGTYRMDTGEREEQEYLNFGLFMRKQRYPKGGLEFSLTSIDMELVMDALIVHPTNEAFETAKMCYERDVVLRKNAAGPKSTGEAQRMRRSKYGGPMLNELDDDLSDEILDYLDERGVNNAFAEYIMAQAHYYEQEEYLNWLRLLRKFSD
ncbi:putative mitochondrial p22 protein precursor [Leptomonas pyrrhocoris]|uniref:Putative mitochondrial p22 protein n=1 Tax=Leptomonas pyrrhocoris TaxID=157538 RepID=A0A0M9G9X2_LEPPY|nr:putative mitochondrial p22 protein precursor [Leptomonas pyrrhocoris]KPA85803.1 putative mitochondrial p22 protein precursor [Leptomonas pyrrhocoris]|eukprot:XP_015664242.1 putative mitochondrial p22 protein precursor [Leptomonas pyrrhocoris]